MIDVIDYALRVLEVLVYIAGAVVCLILAAAICGVFAALGYLVAIQVVAVLT